MKTPSFAWKRCIGIPSPPLLLQECAPYAAEIVDENSQEVTDKAGVPYRHLSCTVSYAEETYSNEGNHLAAAISCGSRSGERERSRSVFNHNDLCWSGVTGRWVSGSH